MKEVIEDLKYFITKGINYFPFILIGVILAIGERDTWLDHPKLYVNVYAYMALAFLLCTLGIRFYHLVKEEKQKRIRLHEQRR